MTREEIITNLCWVIILPAVILLMPEIDDQIGDDPSYSLFSSIVKISFLSLIALIVSLCIHSRAKKALKQIREKLSTAKVQREMVLSCRADVDHSGHRCS